MKYLNQYRAFLIKEMLKQGRANAKEAVKAVDEFVKSEEGHKAFRSFEFAYINSLPRKQEPRHIGKKIWKIHDEINIIQEQG